ncbi:MAG TPA: chromosome segregation protein SMC [Thermoanaerobaculia bacterium]|nr:chromosome segregation protein SMC [Thermoanaerobaculia bacterium]
MLKVEHLHISGFKSFVDPVTVSFAGGITGIVGPNGCGKSNLAEAMTWVLGEQSAKSLRGGTMEDVIFNGAQSRRPLGMAECTLTLRTDLSLPAADDGLISIGRRVFRGGEGQYRLNGKVVRLKEIKDLLMDTGLGIRAYSVIEQGKIGMILSGKPQERRKLLEEAAGITRYKARKNIAEVKLQEATANLLRLDDVIAEVERALRSLKRQASAARRYQEKDREYRDLLGKVLAGRSSLLHAQLAELRARLEEATAREAGIAADLHRDEAALAAGRERLEELAQAMAARHQRVADLTATIHGRQEFLKANRQTVVEIGERAAQDRALAERREQEMAGQAEALAACEARRRELAAEREETARAVDEDDRRIGGAERELAGAAAGVEELRAELLLGAGGLQGLRQRAQQAQIELERGNFRRHHLSEELLRQAHDAKQAGEALALSREKVAELDAALAARVEEHQQVMTALDAILRREAEAVERKRGLEGDIVEARQRQRLLADLSRAHAERRGALLATLAAAGLGEPRFLAERIRAVAGWERSLDSFLGGLADAVVLAAGESARELAASLAGRSQAILVQVAGAAAAAPAAPPAPNTGELPAQEPEGPRAAPDIVTAPDIATAPGIADDPGVVLSLGDALGLPGELAAALPPAFLARSAADAERLARSLPGVAFLSREGVWVQAGTFHVAGEVVTPGVLEREGELAALERSLPDLEQRRQAAAGELDRLVAERAALAGESNRLQGETAQLRQELAVGRARLEDTAARARRLAADQEVLTAEQLTVASELERVDERRTALLAELAAAEERQASLEEDFDRAQADLDTAKAARESLRTASAGRRGRLELLDERLESHDREVARLAAEVDAGRRQVAAWREEAERLGGRRSELENALERADEELQEALEQRADAEDRLLEEQERLDRQRQEVRELDERIGGHRSRRDQVRGEIEEHRVTHAGLRQDGEHLAHTYREQFGEPLPEDPGAPRGDLPELEAELARCKAALERLGPVNVLAVQEHDEQEQRHVFLTAQRADVAQSVDSLRRTIREINEASSERFNATFAAVNQNFNAVFARLFRGGEAEMRLLDDEDVLESGIEIVARPPGKRLQNLMLLSGGEKALTAIALLFALFRAKPSPFCILDEVDAPLDDVNTARFIDLLREMAGETQFIIITHNKLTMEVAGRLYGVTMEEKGVSKLVSVELEDIQPDEQRPREERATA